MAPDERATRSAERCSLHPGTPSVGRCARCGRPLCLTCAVPVRGLVLGAECLTEAIGHEPRVGDGTVAARPGRAPRAVGGAAFLLAVGSTMLPWSVRNVGSGPFGAWGLSPRWSLLAAISATLGLALWIALGVVPPRWRRPWEGVLAALGAATAGGALLAIWHPPAFTDTMLAPWLTAVAGGAACAASIAARRTRETNPGRS